MLLQPSLHNHQNVSISSSLSYSRPVSYWDSTSTLRQSVYLRRLSISCAISKSHSYGAVHYERRPIVRWNDLCRRISLMENPELGSANVLNQWENEGKTLTKWDLCRVVKELRKYNRHERALEEMKMVRYFGFWVHVRKSGTAQQFATTRDDWFPVAEFRQRLNAVASKEEYLLLQIVMCIVAQVDFGL